MKWYSVKKYRPPMEILCFLFTVDNNFYSGKLLCSDDPDVWISDYGSIYGVTHFCIPDPVEIEE